MALPQPFSPDGDWFVDQRTGGRALHVSWHPDRKLVVLSMWHGDVCTGTFRLPAADAPRLIEVLTESVAETGAWGIRRP